MILKGNQRAGASQLAAHLLNVRDNDHVAVHEMRGFVSDDLHGAFNEAYAVSRGTRCKQFLFSLSLNPPETENVPIDAFEKALATIEKRLGLGDQPRAIVFHEKEGRRHAHCVWSRIDMTNMRAINLPHYKMRLCDIARDLYLEHQWDMPQGFVDSSERDPLNFTQAEWQQALRVKSDANELKQAFIDCWESSDTQSSFETTLKDYGLYLARGDRRGYVAVDRRGEIYSLSRWTGKKTKELKARLGPPNSLRSIESTKHKIAKILDNTATKIRGVLDERKSKKLAEYKAKRDDLVVAQRRKRRRLVELQRKRAIAELKDRQAKLPKGLKALWFRITGAYRKFQEKCEQDAITCDQRDKLQAERLVSQQLAERRELKFRAQDEELSYSQQLETAFIEIKERKSQLLETKASAHQHSKKRTRSPRRTRNS